MRHTHNTASPMRLWQALMMVLALGVMTTHAAAQQAVPQPGDGTWHMQFTALWGVEEGGRQAGEPRNLDLYPTFENGQFKRGVATARRYNTSAHIVQKADLKLENNRIHGSMHIILTPDAWVPADGLPVDFHVEIDGQLSQPAGGGQFVLRGTYKGKLAGEDVSGQLGGAVGATEAGWENSAWSASMFPALPPEAGMQPLLTVSVGQADGRVNWASIGPTFKGARPQIYAWDGEGLTTDGGIVTGTSTVPARAVDFGADPDATAKVELTIYRVQGLIAGSATVTFHKDGKQIGEAVSYYGRGSGQRGSGGARDDDARRPLWRHGADTDPWWVPVEGFKAPAAGEHPRLLFRKTDLPALRQRMNTPEGQAILKRLRVQLNGGDGRSLPRRMNTSTANTDATSESLNVPAGEALTLWHGMGYGLLYQLTEDKHYADLGKQAVEHFLRGVRDRDGRYAFRRPNGPLRAGPALSAIAMAYDLCYDGWDDAFRRKVAQEIQNYDEGGRSTLPRLLSGSIIPGSNHYGMQVGGGTIGLLAILNDPGVDMDKLKPLIEVAERSTIHNLGHGWGDHGFFAEGDGTGSMSSHIAFLTSLKAWRNVMGRDFITPRPNAPWMSLKWIFGTIARGDSLEFPALGGYSHNIWSRQGLSGAGYFAIGFGTVKPEHQPAMLGYYHQFLRERDAQAGTPYDTASNYPHTTVQAFVNWPIGVKPVDPGQVLGHSYVDTVHSYIVNRNRWQDGNDILITTNLSTGPDGYIAVREEGRVTIWGHGVRASWNSGMRGHPFHYEAAKNGSTIVSTRHGGISSMAVDLSGTSGADALIVGIGPAFESRRSASIRSRAVDGANAVLQTVKLGGNDVRIITLQRGEAPKATVEGDTIRVGKQTIRFDGDKVVLGTF